MGSYEENENKLIEAYSLKGFTITREQAEEIWSDYSESLFAVWMMMTDRLDDLYVITEEYAKALNII